MEAFFRNKTYLVTGASSGIGRAVTRALANGGANVILLARSQQGMSDTIAGLDCAQCLCLPCDLGQIENIEACIKEAHAWEGAIDGLAYCAGIGGRARVRDTNLKYILERMTVNCFAFVEMVRLLAGLKKKTDPLRVVAVSSLAALGHHRYLAAYSASKAALEASAKAMAVELARRNTRINLIRPAYVDTPMIADSSGSLKDILTEDIQPLGLIMPEEVAAMALYLLGPAAEHINGAIFDLNAGAFD